MTDSFDALIRRLIEENEIDVPIVDIRVVGGKIAFYLYGGEVVVCKVRKDCEVRKDCIVRKECAMRDVSGTRDVCAQTSNEEVKIAL